MWKNRNLEERIKKTERSTHVATFSLEQRGDIDILEDIYQRCKVEKEKGFEILEKKTFVVPEEGMYMFVVWTEPIEVDG